jgi:hypothetical protein
MVFKVGSRWPSETFVSYSITTWHHFLEGLYEGVSRIFRTGRLERELQMVQLSATSCSSIAILWVSLVSFAAITICVASQGMFVVIVVYFVIDSVQKLLDTTSYVHPRRVLSLFLSILTIFFLHTRCCSVHFHVNANHRPSYYRTAAVQHQFMWDIFLRPVSKQLQSLASYPSAQTYFASQIKKVTLEELAVSCCSFTPLEFETCSKCRM